MITNTKSSTTTSQKGFTLIELLVVISIIGLLGSIIIGSLSTSRLRARDSRRLTDMESLVKGLALYYNSNDAYPDSDLQGCGGWDTTGDNDFIAPLLTSQFLGQNILDLTINNSCGNYAYYRYAGGDNGCDPARGSYFVLGVREMEASPAPHPTSPGFSCPGRDFQDEFDWVTGGYER